MIPEMGRRKFLRRVGEGATSYAILRHTPDISIYAPHVYLSSLHPAQSLNNNFQRVQASLAISPTIPNFSLQPRINSDVDTEPQEKDVFLNVSTLYEGINSARENLGLLILEKSEVLEEVMQTRVQQMVQEARLSHYGPRGEALMYELLEQRGEMEKMQYAEILGRTNADANVFQVVLDAWLKSDQHNSVIQWEGAQYIGAAAKKREMDSFTYMAVGFGGINWSYKR